MADDLLERLGFLLYIRFDEAFLEVDVEVEQVLGDFAAAVHVQREHELGHDVLRLDDVVVHHIVFLGREVLDGDVEELDRSVIHHDDQAALIRGADFGFLVLIVGVLGAYRHGRSPGKLFVPINEYRPSGRHS